MIKTHYKHGECVAETVHTILEREEVFTAGAVRNLVAGFEAYGSVVDIRRADRPQNFVMVANSIDSSPQKTTGRRPQNKLGMPDRSVRQILKDDL